MSSNGWASSVLSSATGSDAFGGLPTTPGSSPKKFSKEWFSLMITKRCWIGVAVGGDEFHEVVHETGVENHPRPAPATAAPTTATTTATATAARRVLRR